MAAAQLEAATAKMAKGNTDADERRAHLLWVNSNRLIHEFAPASADHTPLTGKFNALIARLKGLRNTPPTEAIPEDVTAALHYTLLSFLIVLGARGDCLTLGLDELLRLCTQDDNANPPTGYPGNPTLFNRICNDDILEKVKMDLYHTRYRVSGSRETSQFPICVMGSFFDAAERAGVSGSRDTFAVLQERGIDRVFRGQKASDNPSVFTTHRAALARLLEIAPTITALVSNSSKTEYLPEKALIAATALPTARTAPVVAQIPRPSQPPSAPPAPVPDNSEDDDEEVLDTSTDYRRVHPPNPPAAAFSCVVEASAATQCPVPTGPAQLGAPVEEPWQFQQLHSGDASNGSCQVTQPTFFAGAHVFAPTMQPIVPLAMSVGASVVPASPPARAFAAILSRVDVTLQRPARMAADLFAPQLGSPAKRAKTAADAPPPPGSAGHALASISRAYQVVKDAFGALEASLSVDDLAREKSNVATVVALFCAEAGCLAEMYASAFSDDQRATLIAAVALLHQFVVGMRQQGTAHGSCAAAIDIINQVVAVFSQARTRIVSMDVIVNKDQPSSSEPRQDGRWVVLDFDLLVAPQIREVVFGATNAFSANYTDASEDH